MKCWRLISRRIFIEDLGSEAAITRMSEIVFIELVRAGISKDEKLLAMLHALRDKFVGKSLRIDPSHTQPRPGALKLWPGK